MIALAITSPPRSSGKPNVPGHASVCTGAHTTATSHDRHGHDLLTVSGDDVSHIAAVAAHAYILFPYPHPRAGYLHVLLPPFYTVRQTGIEPRGLFLVVIFLAAFVCECECG
jgi:hypothetical protein